MTRGEIIEEMKRRLVERFCPDAIILFGSSARGDAEEDSDIDLLVLTPIEGNYTDLWFRMYDSLGDLGVGKDIILMTKEQFDRDKRYVGTLARPVSQEGKVLYERKRS
jgi:predicted nucleotidyltransferase